MACVQVYLWGQCSPPNCYISSNVTPTSMYLSLERHFQIPLHRCGTILQLSQQTRAVFHGFVTGVCYQTGIFFQYERWKKDIFAYLTFISLINEIEDFFICLLNSYVCLSFSVDYLFSISPPNPLELLLFSLPISRNFACFFWGGLCCCWVFLFLFVSTWKISSWSVIEVAYISPSVALVIAYGFWLCRSFWVLLKFIQFFLKNVFFSGF